MERKRFVKTVIIGGILLALFLIIVFGFSMLISIDPQMLPGDKVGLIEIVGPITSSQYIINQLHNYVEDDYVKSIVLRIDSPGGVVAPVQEIHEELTKINKKVVVSMGSTAASGGYYIACAADWIFANPGTLTGSIGVIMRFTKLEELMKKLGVDQEIIKSGKYKDAGSMYRDLTSEERELFQETMDDVHQQFLDVVVEGRKHKELTRGQIEIIADGRVMSGKQALDVKLIDQLGNLNDAIEYAGKLGGIEGKPKVIKIKRSRSLLERLADMIFDGKLDNIVSDHAVLRYELAL
jgi:protease-4